MVIIGMSSYPPTSANEVGKLFLEQPPLAEFITRRGPYIFSVKGEGYQSISLFEFDNSKMADAMKSIANFFAGLRDAPGFTYSTRVCFELQEALNMIGLA